MSERCPVDRASFSEKLGASGRGGVGVGRYLSVEDTVVSGSPKTISVTKDLGALGRSGYLISDDGTISVQIEEEGAGSAVAEMKVSLELGEQMLFKRDDGWRIRRVRVSTGEIEAVGFRLFLLP